MLSLLEHKSSHYRPRTYHNANSADLTIALAVDYETAGERLTHKAAGSKYLAIPLLGATLDPVEAARRLYREVRQRDLKSPVINIAGNGIYTLSQYGWTQAQVNRHLFLLLEKMHQHWPIRRVVSGGQTGIDIAGIVAAHALGIDAEAMFPNGYLQRGADKQDVRHTEKEIREQVEEGVNVLLQSVMKPSEAPAPQERPVLGSIRVGSKRQGGTRPEKDEVQIHGDRKSSFFGNPFPLTDWTNPRERDRVIEQFYNEVFVPDVLRKGPIFKAMEALSERARAGEKLILMCWCSPLKCHCDHIAHGIQQLAAGRVLAEELSKNDALDGIESHIAEKTRKVRGLLAKEDQKRHPSPGM